MQANRKSYIAGELLKEVRLDKDQSNLEISSISSDSRNILDKSIFFAIKGTRWNGNNFIGEAFQKGASLILSDQKKFENKNVIYFSNLRDYLGIIASRYYENPSKKLKVFCVTGTNGKTSCVEAISQLSSYMGLPCGYISTIGVSVDGKEKSEDSKLTTPDSIFIQKTFADMVEKGIKFSALEVSSHGLSQSRIAGTSVETAILTSFSLDHLDFHKSKKNYELAKKTLFIDFQPKKVILNIDNQFGKKLYKEIKSFSDEVYGISSNKHADISVKFKRISEGLNVSIKTPFGSGTFKLKTISKYLALNIVCAIVNFLSQGFDIKELCQASENIKLPQGRMEQIKINNKSSCFIDFAHTPEALSCSLEEIRETYSGKVFCVFGCGGERDPLKRSVMGNIAESLADKVIITNDNPRNEDEDKIIREILRGFKEPKKVKVIKNRKVAIEESLKEIIQSSEENILLVAGKGHEKQQIIKRKKFAFSDSEVVRSFLDD